ncbi:hypothetical protein CH253_17895 [Rhodococcus sp. 06-156-3C]|uniref:hypothetical protein n=1 Tax=Nocardiaceae TaxID=85025 RepID=UPI000522FB30|nr:MULTISPECIES: hypothetical protein [Rhodococcus]OZD18332.1 hypothetical protein CH280_07220 [Rhodococcus sp. 06-156-4C]OZD18930.1 hypothetical protein CH253_17895 [Rhodococcus sp. 06-156-3C]OZD22440.1 hypothetical protein CH248_09480 [Rhodococcus sp. 06-156-4a]OZD34024.1 hypothetical protein CH247_08010 [Rhodococcus sp. 06-156-3b]OZD38761.1 hypothetical protein CH284_06430 [Rhodococcus sp. 06-156-3]
MIILAGGIILLAVTALTLRIDDHTAHKHRTGIDLAILTALILLTIGIWTTLTDTHNIVHWILKILVTITTVWTCAVIGIRTARRHDDQHTTH